MTYNSQLTLQEVALNVENLKRQKHFYQHILGMTIIEVSDSSVLLGTDEHALVRLMETSDTSLVSNSYGLYHLALLLPSRQDLANLLAHFVANDVRLIGASDHGYSEAIYLEDLEGNGIEVYRDKSVEHWDIREDGKIIGITEALDIQKLYEDGKLLSPYKLPEKTTMGHVHLSVSSSRVASDFLQNILLIDDKFSVDTASWLASGMYHHHLAVNEWNKYQATPKKQNSKGLAYLSILSNSKIYFNEVVNQLAKRDITHHFLSDSTVQFADENGINFILRF